MSSTASSLQWRQYGNQQYQAAGQATNLGSAADSLKKAANAYEEAFKLASDDEERCYALRNLGMANWHLGKNCNSRAKAAVNAEQDDGRTVHYSSSHRTDYSPYFMLHFYKEAITAFRRCIPLIGRLKSMHTTKSNAGASGDANSDRNTPTKFIEQLNKNMDGCAEEAISYLANMDYFPTYKCRIQQLEYLINACGDQFQDWAAVFHLTKASTCHKWAVTEMERSQNYATALSCLKECYSPIENIRRLLAGRPYFGHFSLVHFEQWEDLQESILADTAMAEAPRLIQEGDAILRASIFDAEQIDIDGVHEALDKYRAAIVSLVDGEGVEFTVEAEAFSKMGQVYFEVLKNEIRAKMYCINAVQLANAGEHLNFAGKEWFDKATAILKQIQDEQKRRDEADIRKNRAPFLEKLEKELTELALFADKSAEILIAELPKKFPPKHKSESKVLEQLANMKFTATTPRSEVKKALSKLILLYHSDHVDVKVYGGEYFVLCEEITKVITKKYEYFKG